MLHSLAPEIEARPVAHLAVLRALIDQLRIHAILDEALPKHRLSRVFDADCVVAMMLNILCGRVALFRMDEWLARTDVELLLGPGRHADAFDDNRLAMELDHIDALGTDTVLTAVVQGYLQAPEAGCGPTEGWVRIPGDCDDGNPAMHPDAQEVCNQEDDDCDGLSDDSDPSVLIESPRYEDEDDDGYGAGLAARQCREWGNSKVDGDCDDANPDISPGDEEEVNGVDDDCDGEVDEVLSPPAEEEAEAEAEEDDDKKDEGAEGDTGWCATGGSGSAGFLGFVVLGLAARRRTGC